ncbi:unnamed protein product [Phytomonas sp. EM1]|nr:unnamed protein product [Phytomonas sp. EM1]|eukprot:CCW59636.1 unnamed protein product [Phytomonas sp. isolate EM1]
MSAHLPPRFPLSTKGTPYVPPPPNPISHLAHEVPEAGSGDVSNTGSKGPHVMPPPPLITSSAALPSKPKTMGSPYDFNSFSGNMAPTVNAPTYKGAKSGEGDVSTSFTYSTAENYSGPQAHLKASLLVGTEKTSHHGSPNSTPLRSGPEGATHPIVDSQTNTLESTPAYQHPTRMAEVAEKPSVPVLIRSSNPPISQRTAATHPVHSSFEEKERNVQGLPTRAPGVMLPHGTPRSCGGSHLCLEVPHLADSTPRVGNRYANGSPHHYDHQQQQDHALTGNIMSNSLGGTGHLSGSIFSRKSSLSSQQLSTYRSHLLKGDAPVSSVGPGGRHASQHGGFVRGRSRGEELLVAALERRRASALNATFTKTSRNSIQDSVVTKGLSSGADLDPNYIDSSPREEMGSRGVLFSGSANKHIQPNVPRPVDPNKRSHPADSVPPYACNAVAAARENMDDSLQGPAKPTPENVFNAQKVEDAPQEVPDADMLFFSNSIVDPSDGAGTVEAPISVGHPFPKSSITSSPSLKEHTHGEDTCLESNGVQPMRGSDLTNARSPLNLNTNANCSTSDGARDTGNTASFESSNPFISMGSVKATQSITGIVRGSDTSAPTGDYIIDNTPFMRQETQKLLRSEDEDPLPRPTILGEQNETSVRADEHPLSLPSFPHQPQQGRRLELETPRDDLPTTHSVQHSSFHLQRVVSAEKPSYRHAVSTSHRNMRVYEESPAPRYPEIKTESESTIQFSETPSGFNAKSPNAVDSVMVASAVKEQGEPVEYPIHNNETEGLMLNFDSSVVGAETHWAKAEVDPNVEPKSNSDLNDFVKVSSSVEREEGKALSQSALAPLSRKVVEHKPTLAVHMTEDLSQDTREQILIPKVCDPPKPPVSLAPHTSEAQVTQPDEIAASTGTCTSAIAPNKKNNSFTLASIISRTEGQPLFNHQPLTVQEEKQEAPGIDTMVNPFAISNSHVAVSPASSAHLDSSSRLRPRRPHAPCFALFHPKHGGIVAVFNQPVELTKGGVPLRLTKRSPERSSLQGVDDVMSSRNTQKKKDFTRSHLVFCRLSDAMSRFNPSGKQNVVKGTEAGRRYVASLEAVALSPFFASDGVSPLQDFNNEKSQELLSILQQNEHIPLTRVLTIMLADALAHNEHAFVWSKGGDKELVHLLMNDDSAISSLCDSRGVDGTGAGYVELLPQKNSHPSVNSQEGLNKVQQLLCEGNREGAVDVALEHHLFLHAVLIAMMCPTKEHYMKTIQKVVCMELQPHSPLAHAYCLFNEMPLPPFAPYPTAHAKESDHDPSTEGIKCEQSANTLPGHSKESQLPKLLLSASEPPLTMAAARRQNRDYLKSSWLQQAAMLIANFTRHSGDGLLQLGNTLEQVGLILEAHTCFLLGHLCPLGMAKGGKLTKPETDAFRNQLRSRLSVLGGVYASNVSGRAAFLTPTSTLLTDLLQEVRCHLDQRFPPPLPESQLPDGGEGTPTPLLPCHGLPMRPFRYAVAFHFMQILWLREVGMLLEADRALQDLLKVMPPPKLMLPGPPRTLNELVYIFARLPLPAPVGPQTATHEEAPHQPEDQRVHQNVEIKAVEGPTLSCGAEALPEAAPCAKPSLAPPQVRSSPKPDDSAASLPCAPPPPMHLNTSSSQQLDPSEIGKPALRPTIPQPVEGANLFHSASLTSTTSGPAPSLSGIPPPPPPLQRAKSPPTPPSGTREQTPPPQPKNRGYSSMTPPKASDDHVKGKSDDTKASKVKRSRSIETIMSFFRREKGDLTDHKKAEVTKPMILDTKPVPQFDQATGRWMFPQSEEDKAREALAKAGPPKMPPGGVGSKGPNRETPFPQQRRGPAKKAQYVDMFNT